MSEEESTGNGESTNPKNMNVVLNQDNVTPVSTATAMLHMATRPFFVITDTIRLINISINTDLLTFRTPDPNAPPKSFPGQLVFILFRNYFKVIMLIFMYFSMFYYLLMVQNMTLKWLLLLYNTIGIVFFAMLICSENRITVLIVSFLLFITMLGIGYYLFTGSMPSTDTQVYLDALSKNAFSVSVDNLSLS